LTTSNSKGSKSSFAADVTKMAFAPAFTQALGLIVIPILTRLYSPDAFGGYAVLASICDPFLAFVTMSYAMAIMLPDNEKEVGSLICVCLFFSLLVSAALGLLVLLVRGGIIEIKMTQGVGNYLWLLPISIFLSGLSITLRYWNLRKRRFGNVSLSNMAEYTTNNALTLAAGCFGYASVLSLFLGSLLGLIVKVVVMTHGILVFNLQLIRSSFKKANLLAVTRRYKKFPIYVLWTDVVSRFSLQVPIYFLSSYFSQTLVGYYSLGLRLLTMPVSLIGNSIGEVYFQREAQKKSSDGSLLTNLFERLVASGTFFFVLLALIGRDLFGFVFGAQWAEAGTYAQILSFSIYVRFITIPASYLTVIWEKQNVSLILRISEITLSLMAVIIGGVLRNEYVSLGLLSFLIGFLYALISFWVMRMGGLSLRDVSRILLKYLSLSIPLVGSILASRLIFHGSGPIIMIGSFIMLCLYIFVLIRDKQIQQSFLEIIRVKYPSFKTSL
jgi:O-antigen/teichoic acid export membrane protein